MSDQIKPIYSLTLNFCTHRPPVKRGSMGYFLIRCINRDDGKVRTFAAYYLNQYGLNYEDGCSDCPFDDTCKQVNGGPCPTTGWFYETVENGDDGFYNPVSGDVEAWAELPGPSE